MSERFSKKTQEEWYKLISSFRSSKEIRDKSLEDWLESDTLLESILFYLQQEKDETFKINLLIFIQENVSYFLEDTKVMEKVCNVLNSLLSIPDSPGNTFHFKGQILVTLTTILIDLDVIHSQPRVFETFVEMLFDLIQRVNEGTDRLLRETACQCLQELELMYPGLFTFALGHLLDFCRKENTHAAQAYLTLMATLLEHGALQLLEDTIPINPRASTGASFYLLSTEIDLCPFSVAESTKYHPIPLSINVNKYQLSSKLSEASAKEVGKCIAVLLDNYPLLTSWGSMYIIFRLLVFVQFGGLEPKTLKHSFAKFAFTHNLLLFHMYLLLKKNFQDIFTEIEEKMLIDHLFGNAKDTNLSLEQRILCIEWILHFPLHPSRKLIDILNKLYLEFYPSVFDLLELKYTKLKALSYVFDEKTPSYHPPADLLQVLHCLDEFTYYGPNDYITTVLFSILRAFLLKFPSFFDKIYDYILKIILKYPKFLPPLIRIINQITKSNPNNPIPLKILTLLNSVLISMDPPKLINFLPLIETIIIDKRIEPTNLVNALYQMLSKSTIRQSGWKIGNSILSICRAILLHHSPVVVFKPLGDTLLFLSNYFEEIEIRDRSHFYYQLLTHVGGEKIKKIILPDSERQDEEETFGLISPNPKLVLQEKNKKTKLIGISFLSLEPLPILYFSTSNDNLETSTLNKETKVELIPDSLKNYLTFIQSKEFVPTVEKKFCVKYKKSEESTGQLKGFTIPPKIFALILHFGSSPVFAPLNKIDIPFLTKWNPSNRNEENQKQSEEQFPFQFNFSLHFQPKAPIPTSFQVKISFNDHEAKPCKGELDPISLNFQDLFLPIPIPPQFLQLKESFLASLFDQLWKKVIYLWSPSSSNHGGKSIKALQFSAEEWELFQRRLKPFSVSCINQDEGKDIFQVAIFLPPRFHLLMKIRKVLKSLTAYKNEESSTQKGQENEESTKNYFIRIKLRTDFWRVFICLDSFFRLLLTNS